MKRRETDFDIAVVGGGHNALVAAAYLAKAGHRVGVFERRSLIGGAVATEEVVPGYQFDLGGSAHILIRLTPIVEELELEKFGLEYLELDPLFYAPFRDGSSVTFHRSLDRTVEELEAAFPTQGIAYRSFVERWEPFAEMVKEAFLAPPTPWELGKRFVFGSTFRSDWKKAVSTIRRPYGDVLGEYLTEPKIRTPMEWMAAQSGPPPTEPFGAPFLLWHPLYHSGGIARPRGGSGMLTQALARCIEYHGGEVHTATPVRGIRVEGSRAVGIVTDAGESSARAVMSGVHVLEFFDRLLPSDHRPDGADSIRVGNGFGAILRVALDRPVQYTAEHGDRGRIGLQLLCDNQQQILDAYGEYLQGRPASNPPIVAMTFTSVDPSLAPAGGEVLWLWGQYFPYELAEGSWAEMAPRVADTLLDTFERYAPGTRDNVVGTLMQDPSWLERELGLFRGNVMHLEMGLDQMFGMRPLLGMSGYRGHLKGLYLTGASTHPGGGIMGASGRNAARVLLRDLDRRRV